MRTRCHLGMVGMPICARRCPVVSRSRRAGEHFCHLGRRLEPRAWLKRAGARDGMGERRGCIIKILLKNLLVSLVIGTDTRKRKAKNASDGVDITSRIGLGKAVLFGRGEPQVPREVVSLLAPSTRMRAIPRSMRYAPFAATTILLGEMSRWTMPCLWRLLGRLAKLDAKRCRLFRHQRPIGFDNFGKRPTRHKVVDDNKVLG